MPASPFQIRGVVEGFYGVFYTFPERDDLIRFIGRHGYNTYIYGPKNDRQHRARWWEPYPDEIMGQFANTVAVARESGVSFCYAISPISYESDADFEKIAAKLHTFFRLGVRAFSILVDDIMPSSDQDPEGKGHQHYADLHAGVCNRLYDWLKSLSADCTLSMCPIDYHGAAPFSNYLRALGEALHPQIDIFYTGTEICSPTIRAAEVAEFGRVVRRPPVIWDNYPANDLSMRSELHIGPVRGRDPELARVARGVVVNTMIQAEASKIALLTFAEYFRDPAGYDPEAAWERALREGAGWTSYAALRQFAENSLHSCIEPADAPQLEDLTRAVMAALREGDRETTCQAAQALTQYLNSLDESCYFLKNRMPNLHLRDDLLPWITALEDWVWLGRRALTAIEALDRGGPTRQQLLWLNDSLQEIHGHNKRIGGRALMPLAQYVLDRVPEAAAMSGQTSYAAMPATLV